MVEHSLGKGEVGSSILPMGTMRLCPRRNSFNAGIAQLVERNLAKVEVASSSLVSRSSVSAARQRRMQFRSGSSVG